MKFLKLIRVHQWTKNIFVLAPLFFSGKILDSDKLIPSLLGVVIFCIVSSATYILNDLLDYKEDRIHPKKKYRAIASGNISKPVAITWYVLLLTLGLISSVAISTDFFQIVFIYIIVNILYSIGIKKISLIDVFVISFGFVLRVNSGGILADVPVSHWLYIMTFLLALFIAFAKRRDDVLILNATGSEMRTSVKGYNLEFISSSISILIAVLVVSYLLYITSPELVSRFEGKHAYISTLFVVLGVFRYLQITLVESNSGSPSKLLLKDLFLQLILLGWILFFFTIIYII